MEHLTALDVIALVWFLAVWMLYATLIENTRFGKKSVNLVMENYRYIWFRTLLRREQRMIDTGVMNGLQNGTAFFASTSLLAIGGTFSLLQSSEKLLNLVSLLPGFAEPSLALLQFKIVGLSVIFVYAFFKFTWAYRLFNYSGIIIGACPVKDEAYNDEAKRIADRGARMNITASRHFNRGLRGFFFALGYLGWFIHPLVFLVGTGLIAVVLYRRQFASDALEALH